MWWTTSLRRRHPRSSDNSCGVTGDRYPCLDLGSAESYPADYSPGRAALTMAGRVLGQPGRSALLQLFDRDIETSRVDHALALKLDPNAVRSGAREDQIELHLSSAIGDERVVMNQID
jgi:hypothetical protein